MKWLDRLLEVSIWWHWESALWALVDEHERGVATLPEEMPLSQADVDRQFRKMIPPSLRRRIT